MSNNKFSLLYPTGWEGYKELSEVTFHDLGLDLIVKEVTKKEVNQRLITRILSRMTEDPAVTRYRGDIFDDIYHNREMREKLMEILDKINFLKDFGSFKHEFDEKAGIWDLMHRLDEIKDYISCVEAIHECLDGVELKSEGLKALKTYVDDIFKDSGFAQIKEDIKALNAETSRLKSVTVGINLNDRFEAESIGLISVNAQAFTKSNVLGNFFDFVAGSKDRIKENAEWDKDYKYHTFTAEGHEGTVDTMAKLTMMRNPLMMGLSTLAYGNPATEIGFYMDRIVNNMISGLVKRIRDVLNKYVTITITDMTDLIPEFVYYISFAEYIEKLRTQGASFCKAEPAGRGRMSAKGIYNMKLAAFMTEEREEIITNDLIFDDEHRVYILTGANRGGKTTITQAIGQLYVLAQGGIYVPGDEFCFSPVDQVFTHFPADEDKTMDLGRLGEECKRFRELYTACTKDSLLLLNETFSTTSFEEGYYIAKDSVKAILSKGVSTIYNTHMHKLAFDVEELNQGTDVAKAQSLVVLSEEGKRSYKVRIQAPVGQSFASDIAKKYGVTYEMLTGNN